MMTPVSIRIRFLLLFLFSFCIVLAQEKGKVIDRKTRMTLGCGNIYLNGGKGIGVTDENGEFDIKILSEVGETDTVYFSYIGYLTEMRLLKDLKRDHYQVLMKEDAQQLREVTVIGRTRIRRLPVQSLHPMPDGLFSLGALVHDGKIYVIGGDATEIRPGSKKMQGVNTFARHSPKMYIYDIKSDLWTTSKHKFRKRANHAIHFYDNRIYVLGGKRLSTSTYIEYSDETVEIYDMDRDTLLVDPVNPHQALNFASFVYKDYLFVMGGLTRRHVYSDKIHVFNFKTGYWYEAGKMPEAKETRGALVGHTAYLFDGWNIQSYDLLTGKWENVGELVEGVFRPGIAQNGNYIYIYEYNKLQVFDVVTKELAVFDVDLKLENTELVYDNNKLYFVGGCSKEGICLTPAYGFYCIDCRIFQ